ncbi:hypothetical protein HZS55_09000 [Halosimplex rubrum]|uniref:Uncharacterized protein n=1 Tax=Halosimplex rubrum TaxID=869889 RepID=A0A7D5P3P8_9EURY|nr:hypothetical protein [Halosimplex rubrum]QLH77424.1 hypothetical protein HZS55_09000 [Halosimplex rubrum]
MSEGDHVAEAIESYAARSRGPEDPDVACIKTVGGNALFCPLDDVALVRRDGELRADREGEAWISSDTVRDIEEVR